jgi:hypothetical protein
MLDDLIQNAVRLMREQAEGYRRLQSASSQLGAALVSGQPELIESHTRAGEEELLRMRVRLVHLMTALAAFADGQAGKQPQSALGAETRAAFREASDDLFRAAGEYQRVQSRIAAVANNGAIFAAAVIELCGVPPLTYRAPYARRGGAGSWA